MCVCERVCVLVFLFSVGECKCVDVCELVCLKALAGSLPFAACVLSFYFKVKKMGGAKFVCLFAFFLVQSVNMQNFMKIFSRAFNLAIHG